MKERRTLACIALALLCVFAGFMARGPDETAYYKCTQASEKLALGASDYRTDYQAQHPSQSNQSAPCGDASFKWPEWMHDPAWWQFIASVLGIGFIAWQVFLTKGSVKASRRSANAAYKTVALIIQKERPKITIYLEDFELDLQFPFAQVEGPSGPELDTRRYVQYDIHCDCPTGAVIVGSGMEARIRSNEGIGAIKGTDKLDPPIPIEGLRTISGIQVLNLKTRVPAVFDRPLRHEVRIGLLTVVCWGFIEYRGRYQRDDDPPYRTSIRKRWVPDRNTAIPGYMEPGYWEVEGDPEDNQQT